MPEVASQCSRVIGSNTASRALAITTSMQRSVELRKKRCIGPREGPYRLVANPGNPLSVPGAATPHFPLFHRRRRLVVALRVFLDLHDALYGVTRRLNRIARAPQAFLSFAQWQVSTSPFMIGSKIDEFVKEGPELLRSATNFEPLNDLELGSPARRLGASTQVTRP